MNKNNVFTLTAGLILAAVTGCTKAPTEVGSRTDALDSKLWDQSKWISVVDAPVVTGAIGGANERAADGASWFLTTMKNEKAVSSVKWMTAGLGVYQLYVNGQIVGKEILKPGFTHYEKTKRSFTCDITDAFST